ncbi:hypothetical protein K701_13445 [Streptomyces fradiae ATCC 10745 = DSM 40063]|uniref:Secreted protein n=1 Tax=Streptomyces fradiae ATCC 10745 = DSM 40063 TaxID=1319510 RepID=A0ABQ6XUS0_STRFR|nr:hypothetical protein K701_13445 [Streptomyces fradiae ATCC 10745 = DSM 40063]
MARAVSTTAVFWPMLSVWMTAPRSLSRPSAELRYLPVSSPTPSGDHRAATSPRLSAMGRSSRSAVRSTRLYSCWMPTIGAQFFRSARVAARETRRAGKLDSAAWWILPALARSSSPRRSSSIGVSLSGKCTPNRSM